MYIYLYLFITSPEGKQKFEDSHFTPQSKGYYEVYIVSCRGNNLFSKT